MSGGVDSSTVAAMLAHETAPALRNRRRPHPPALGPDPPRRQARHSRRPKAGRCCSLDDVYDARRVAEHSASPTTSSTSKSASSATSSAPSSTSTSPAARPFPARSATTTSSSTQLSRPPAPSARSASPPATTRSTSSTRPRPLDPQAPADQPRTRPTSSSASPRSSFPHALPPRPSHQARSARSGAPRGLALAEKPDSQEICFIPGGDYKQFITAYLEEQGEQMPETAGELVASSGEVLGRHEGISNFTVGQRKGLGVSSPHAALRAQHPPRQPPRHRRRRRRAGHANAPRQPPQLDQHPALTAPCASAPRSAIATSPPGPRLSRSTPGVRRPARRRSRRHLRRTAARRHPRPVRRLLRRRRSRRRRLDRLLLSFP
jgi:hypothetical protein